MAVDAGLTILGPARVERWTCDDDVGFERACAAERELVEQVAREVSRQTGQPVRLGAPLVPAPDAASESQPAEYKWSMLPVGDYGTFLAWLQQPVGSGLAGPGPHLSAPRANQHLFLPLVFPEPFVAVSGDDQVTVASLPLAAAELAEWIARTIPARDAAGIPVPEAERTWAENLARVLSRAEERGVAVEVF
jgi:hypothetical protein